MKTHYRYPATMSVYATIRHLHDDRARWKRKNRIARFKATISRLRSENAQLKKELQNEINFRFSALKALLETRQELAKLRKEQTEK